MTALHNRSEITGPIMVTPGSIFAKTPKGTDEVLHRTHRLGPRVRQLLIMTDGKRDTASLMALFQPEIGASMLAQLVDGGFVQELAGSVAPPPPAAAGVATIHHTAPAPLAEAGDEDPFLLGQTFMVNLAKRILGIAGDPIIAKLRTAHDIAGLRGMYMEWRNTIKQAPDGLLRLKELEKKLAKVLGELPQA